MNRINFAWMLGLLIPCAILLHGGKSAFAISNKSEPAYEEATLKFRDGQITEALSLLERALESSPGERELLEMKALCLQRLNKPEKAAVILRELIVAAGKSKDSKQFILGYEFQLGNCELQLRRFKEARRAFETTRDAKFNIGASRYYLGLIHVEEKKLATARQEFEWLVENDKTVLVAAAHVQLAQLELAEGKSRRALWHYLKAYRQASQRIDKQELPTEPKSLAKRIASSVQTALDQVMMSHFFGSLSFFAAYDSDVYAPIGTSIDKEATDVSTSKAILQGKIGYATSLMQPWQFVGTYELHGNHNLNPDARSAQFIVNDLILYLNRHPLNRVNWGLKSEVSYAFRLKEDLSTGSRKYGPYEFWGEVAPYLNYGLPGSSRLQTGGHLVFRPMKRYADVDLDEELHRTGHEIGARLYLKREEPDTPWNPEVAVESTLGRTNGVEFRSRSFALSLSNRFELSSNLSINFGVTGTLTSYPERAVEARSDKIFSMQVGVFYWLSPKFLLSMETRYANNETNVSVYRSSRLVTGVGFSTLF